MTSTAAERHRRLPAHANRGDLEHEAVASPDPAAADDPADALLADFRRAMTRVGHASALAALSPKHRELVEPVVLDGLNPGQIADRRGHPVKAVRRNLQAAVEKLAAAGRVPDHLAAAAGLDAGELTHRAKTPRVGPKGCAARQALVAEAGDRVPAKELAALLGCSVNVVTADRRAVRLACVAAA